MSHASKSNGRFSWPLAVVVACGLLAKAEAADAPPADLADAAETADWNRVQKLLDAGVDVAAKQNDGTTALHWSAFHDQLDVTQRLLAAGAPPNLENRFGVSPLSLAATNGNHELVRLLLKAGADPNTSLPGGEGVLMTAARTGRPAAVQALLDAGAKVDAADRKDQTALMWAAADGHAEVVRMLIRAGADPGKRLKSGFTPLLFAAREGKQAVVQVLLGSGADANERIETPKGGGRAPVTGTSALILAVENGHFELAKQLLDAGADSNDQSSGFTPLHTLTWVRKPNRGDDESGQPPPTGSGNLTSLQLVEELVRHGADVNARLKKGPKGGGKLGMPGATPFMLAAKTADIAYLKLLVQLGADSLLTNDEGCTPLMAAAGIGTLAPTEEGGTESEALEVVEYLISLGGDVNAVDRNGETAMHGAAYKSLPRMVHFLSKHGAKLELWNRKNKYGWTPQLIAHGYRPGNFKPSAETIEALNHLVKSAELNRDQEEPKDK